MTEHWKRRPDPAPETDIRSLWSMTYGELHDKMRFAIEICWQIGNNLHAANDGDYLEAAKHLDPIDDPPDHSRMIHRNTHNQSNGCDNINSIVHTLD